MKQRTALVGLGLSLAAWIAIMPHDPMAPTDPRPLPAPTPIVHIEEDDPGWDCNTMGNRLCGPQDERDQDGQPPVNHPLIGPDGKSHSPCWIVVPPTGDGWAQCEDGYIERP